MNEFEIVVWCILLICFTAIWTWN